MILVLFIILLLIIIIGLLSIYYVVTYNKYQEYIIRINESESKIDNNIREKFDLLGKAINVIRGTLDIEGDIFPDIVKLRSRKLSSFDLNRRLASTMLEFDKIKEENDKLQKSDTFKEIDEKLQSIETDIDALQKYYNSIISKYNTLVRTFPSNIVAKFSHYKVRNYFDGKDMNDDITNDFKL